MARLLLVYAIGDILLTSTDPRPNVQLTSVQDAKVKGMYLSIGFDDVVGGSVLNLNLDRFASAHA